MSWDDDEDRDEEGGDDGGVLAPCPHCGEEIYDDAERCPKCGMYLSAEDAPGAGWPLWMKVGAVLAILVCAMLAGILSLPALFR